MSKTDPKPIRLYPVPGVFADPWPSQEFDATPEEWEAIQAYIPPPFTDKAPSPPETPAEGTTTP